MINYQTVLFLTVVLGRLFCYFKCIQQLNPSFNKNCRLLHRVTITALPTMDGFNTSITLLVCLESKNGWVCVCVCVCEEIDCEKMLSGIFYLPLYFISSTSARLCASLASSKSAEK